MKLFHMEKPTEEMVKQLEAAYLLDYSPTTPQKLLMELEQGTLQLWYILPEKQGDPFGSFITRIVDRTKGKCLFIAYLKGGGIRRNSDEVLELLMKLARDLECNSIEAEVAHEGLFDTMLELGFEQMTARLTFEVSSKEEKKDGQRRRRSKH